MSDIVRKPIFGFLTRSDKPGCTATVQMMVEILDLESRGIALSM